MQIDEAHFYNFNCYGNNHNSDSSDYYDKSKCLVEIEILPIYDVRSDAKNEIKTQNFFYIKIS